MCCHKSCLNIHVNLLRCSLIGSKLINHFQALGFLNVDLIYLMSMVPWYQLNSRCKNHGCQKLLKQIDMDGHALMSHDGRSWNVGTELRLGARADSATHLGTFQGSEPLLLGDGSWAGHQCWPWELHPSCGYGSRWQSPCDAWVTAGFIVDHHGHWIHRFEALEGK